MKRIVLLLSSLLAFASCERGLTTPQPDVTPDTGDTFEYVDFSADINSDENTKVSFDYTDGMYLHWEGDEQMDVYIKSGDSYSYAGRIPAVEGTLSDDKTGIKFAGQVAKRNNPETDTFVFVYTNSGAAYDWTKQTLDMTEPAAGTDGRKALKSYSPLVFTADSEGNISLENKACYIKFTASNLGNSVNVKSLSIYSPNEAVFPKCFDLSTFDYQSANRSKTLSYAFENLTTDASGNLTVFLAAPVIRSGEKDYQIHVVTEDGNHTISTLSTKGITSSTAMSSSKLYKLTRDSFAGATNPASTVGQTQGGSNGASDVVIESIVGQWDKTGYLSNDIYGVLDMGKPENLTYQQNAAINSIHRIYNHYFSGNLEPNIHGGAVRVAGKQGQPEGVAGLDMSADGPQYVKSYDNTGTFNNIVLTKDTEVYMTFIDSKAWNTNTIGYYCYSGDTDSEGVAYSSAAGHKNVHDLIVFPSTSQSTRGETLIHKFESKTTAQILYPSAEGQFSKTFPAGTTIGLMERVNALEESADFALKAISNSSPVHYTNIAWNQLNTLSFCDYWNQIAVLKFKMPEDADFNRHGLIYAMKDKYAAHGASNEAANWTNPIILIYTSEPDAIDFERSKDYWTHTVQIGSEDAAYKISYNLESVTSSRGDATATFSGTSYSTVLNVANAEFGQFSTLKVVSGTVDITSKAVVTSNNGMTATVTIQKADLYGDVVITAHASRKIKVQSLTASELNELGMSTRSGDLPRFRLILHGVNKGAFGINTSGESHILGSSQTPFAENTYPQPSDVKVADQYNDYEWSIEQAKDGSGNVIGFCLKKVTKYTDEDVRTDGFITRGPYYVTGSYPYVGLGPEGTALVAEQAGSAYNMYLKSLDSDYQYMTCAFGYNLKLAAFSTMSNSGHVNGYGVWRVYKVWIE